MEQEVTLLEMLEAREARASRQREILDSLGCPVVSFTMNIPGPVKTDQRSGAPSGRVYSAWTPPWKPPV